MVPVLVLGVLVYSPERHSRIEKGGTWGSWGGGCGEWLREWGWGFVAWQGSGG